MRRTLQFCPLPLWLVVLSGCGLLQSSNTPKGAPVAVVNGQTIYEDDLIPHVQADLRRLRTQEYEIKNRALQGMIYERLWRADAAKRGLAPEKILEQEVDPRVPDPADAEIESQYQLQKAQLKKPEAEAKAEIKLSLKRAKVREARRAYFQQLWDAAGVSILLKPPKFEVAFDRLRVRGNLEAPVVIVEFSDFQCPYCRRVQPALAALLAKYPGQVSLAYRDFPLRDIHPQAQIAAEAARCAGEQGKFWEYHDALFGADPAFDRPALEAHAKTLGLDTPRFTGCLDSGKFRAAVEEDLQAGLRAGVGSTPAFFINGTFLEGAQPQTAFEALIQAELAALKRK